MKVTSTSSSSTASGASGTKAAADGFRVDLGGGEGVSRPAVNGVGAAAGVGGVGALLALQGFSGAARDRALRKGRRMLDALDRLQLALLGDGPTPQLLDLLNRALEEQRDPSGDAALDDTLNWAEIRVAVEAAKLSRAA